MRNIAEAHFLAKKSRKLPKNHKKLLKMGNIWIPISWDMKRILKNHFLLNLVHKKSFRKIYNMYIKQFWLYFFSWGCAPDSGHSSWSFFGISSSYFHLESSLNTVYPLIPGRPIVWNFFRVLFLYEKHCWGSLFSQKFHKNSQKWQKNYQKSVIFESQYLDTWCNLWEKKLLKI